MDCLNCEHLKQVLESKTNDYFKARSSAFYLVSTKLAARKNVDMERARNDWEEHQFICPHAAAFKAETDHVAA